jgi:uncharacterized protein (TIGR02246 family)
MRSTGMTLTPTEMADELAIRDLTAAFSDAVNRRAPDDLGPLWSPDGVWVVPGMGETEGPEAIGAQLAGLLEQFSFLCQTVHSGQVWLEGDRARARWYLSELGTDHDGNVVQFIGVYHDRHVRTDGGWRFERRRFDFLYRGTVEAKGRSYPFPSVD